MVEHAAVNRGVAGSSPARGAQDSRLSAVFSFIGIQIPCQQAKGFRESRIRLTCQRINNPKVVKAVLKTL